MRTADPSADGRRSAKIFAIVELLSAGDISFRPLPPGDTLSKMQQSVSEPTNFQEKKSFAEKFSNGTAERAAVEKNLRNPNTSERAQKLTA